MGTIKFNAGGGGGGGKKETKPGGFKKNFFFIISLSELCTHYLQRKRYSN